MMAQPSTDQLASRRANEARSHILGLVGANLIVGAIVLWGLPLLLWRGEGPWLARLMAPWRAADAGFDGTVLLCDALVVAAILGGAVLIVSAARRLGQSTAD